MVSTIDMPPCWALFNRSITSRALVERQAKVEMETEWSIRQSIDATTKLQTLQMERECAAPPSDRSLTGRGSIPQNQRRDHSGGDGHQNIVGTHLNPLMAARWSA